MQQDIMAMLENQHAHPLVTDQDLDLTNVHFLRH
jgi:hypothetical protein